MEQETRYSAYDRSNESTYKESTYLSKARGWWFNIQVGMMVVNVVLSLIFAIVFIILTAVGKENISTYDGAHSLDKRCDCTLFTPSLGYGLAASLFIEVGLIALVLVFAILAFLCKTEKLFLYYALVDGSFLALNGIAFLCMTLAVIVFVVRGSYCCSVTSITVASLSAVILAMKIVFITVIGCSSCLCDSDNDS